MNPTAVDSMLLFVSLFFRRIFFLDGRGLGSCEEMVFSCFLIINFLGGDDADMTGGMVELDE